MPRLCAQIYDCRGRAGDPLEQVYQKSLQRCFDRRRHAKDECLAGGVMPGCFGAWEI
jgi:hypothetical protein